MCSLTRTQESGPKTRNREKIRNGRQQFHARLVKFAFSSKINRLNRVNFDSIVQNRSETFESKNEQRRLQKSLKCETRRILDIFQDLPRCVRVLGCQPNCVITSYTNQTHSI